MLTCRRGFAMENAVRQRADMTCFNTKSHEQIFGGVGRGHTSKANNPAKGAPSAGIGMYKISTDPFLLIKGSKSPQNC